MKQGLLIKKLSHVISHINIKYTKICYLNSFGKALDKM